MSLANSCKINILQRKIPICRIHFQTAVFTLRSKMLSVSANKSCNAMRVAFAHVAEAHRCLVLSALMWGHRAQRESRSPPFSDFQLELDGHSSGLRAGWQEVAGAVLGEEASFFRREPARLLQHYSYRVVDLASRHGRSEEAHCVPRVAAWPAVFFAFESQVGCAYFS